MDLRHRLREALEPRLADEGVDLVDVEVQNHHRRRIIRFLVDEVGEEPVGGDAPRAGVSVEYCARVSRMIEDILDTADLIPFAYVLEVSSPGINRPLTKPRHYERHLGERVIVRMNDGFGERRQFSGALVALEDGHVQITLESGEGVALPLSEVRSARVDIDPWANRRKG